MQLIQPLARLGVTPNTLTIIGLLLSVLTAAVIAQGFLVVGGMLVLLAGIFDMFDGAMARIRNEATTFGAFFDSTLDRYSESIILFGLLYYTLQHPGMQDPLWPALHEQTWMISLVYIAVVGSLMVSYTKARAEGLRIECKTGLLARPERVIILAVGLLINMSIWAVAILAVFGTVTAVERMISVWRSTRHVTAPSQHTNSITHDTNDQKQQLSATVTTSEADQVHNSHGRPVTPQVPPFTESVPHD